MGAMSIEQVNEQAATIASQVLNEPVIAAARCEQVTEDQRMRVAGIGAGTRGMARASNKMGRGMMPGVGKMAKGPRSAGLPDVFLLAVTSTQVHALEEKEKKGRLEPGKLLRSWDREGFMAKLGAPVVAAVSGAPDDRQILILFLPLDESNKYLAAAASAMAATGSPGKPYNFMVAKDGPSQAIIGELVPSGAAPAIQVGGMSAEAAFGQAAAWGQGFPQPAAADSTAQLTQLAQLHASGALTDEEFAAQKARIIGG